MNNDCKDCQDIMNSYLLNNPTETGGQSINFMDILCTVHLDEALKSGRFSPMTAPIPNNGNENSTQDDI